MKNTPVSGFTLVELMITVAIIGIIAAIAYPSYRNYATQTRRSDAQIGLTQAANQQERFFTECSHYARYLHGTSRSCATNANKDNGYLAYNKAASTTILSPELHYVITLIDPTTDCPITSCYVLQATPATTAQGGTDLQSGDGNFRITSTGVKTWAKDGTNYNYKWTDK